MTRLMLHRARRLMSVLHDARVDLFAPGDNAASEIAGVRETVSAHELDGLSAPPAELAVDDDLGVWIEFGQMLRQCVQRNELAADITNLIFRWLAHIDEREVAIFIAPLLQLLNGDFEGDLQAHAGYGV